MFCRRHLLGGILSTSALGALTFAGVSAGRAASTTPLVAAASSLRFALPEITSAFAEEVGFAPRFSFGSSGNLARQIRQGAPFELFLSADEALVLALSQDRHTLDEGILYALGQLAIFAPNGAPIEADAELIGIKAALARGELRNFAIANPDHAPYGRAARETLQHASIWGAIKSRLVFGENVSQAAQFAISGSCDGALISHSLAASPRFADRGAFEIVPQAWHGPLRHRMALLPSANEEAKQFYSFLGSAKARTIFSQHGFSTPGDR